MKQRVQTAAFANRRHNNTGCPGTRARTAGSQEPWIALREQARLAPTVSVGCRRAGQVALMMSLTGSGSPTLVGEVARRMNSRPGGHMTTCWSPVALS